MFFNKLIVKDRTKAHSKSHIKTIRIIKVLKVMVDCLFTFQIIGSIETSTISLLSNKLFRIFAISSLQLFNSLKSTP